MINNNNYCFARCCGFRELIRHALYNIVIIVCTTRLGWQRGVRPAAAVVAAPLPRPNRGRDDDVNDFFVEKTRRRPAAPCRGRVTAYTVVYVYNARNNIITI